MSWEMKAVFLKNGAEEAEVLVRVVMLSLGNLMEQNPIVFYELVQLCKNREHKLFGNTGEILEKLRLVENGEIHDSIRNVVLSAVEGDGLNIRLTSPLAI
jgi:hypothetical protein